jgi:four helix bundle protein
MGDYRQLKVWQRSQGMALKIYRSTEEFPVRERYGLAAQMRRAAVSVVSNIAEGCGRQGDRELTRFLRIARGSVRELECQLLLSRELGYLEQQIWTDLDRDTEEISRMLNGLIRSF